MNLNNHWLALDRAYEEKQAYDDSVHYLAETAYDEAIEQIRNAFTKESDISDGLLIVTTVGTLEIDFEEYILNHSTFKYDDVLIIDEDKLWNTMYEATEYYIEKQKDLV